MNTRYLAIFATLACLGFSVTAAAHDCAEHKKENGHCAPSPPPPPPPPPASTFKVEVYFTNTTAPADGTDPAADGKTHGQRRTVSGPSLALVLTSLDSLLPGAPCTITTFGTPTAQFALTTYKNKKSGLFTFVTADFFNFNAGTGVDYALVFGPGDDGEVVDSGAGWLPSGVGTTSVRGNTVRLRAQKGSNADDPCNKDIPIFWQFDVKAN